MSRQAHIQYTKEPENFRKSRQWASFRPLFPAIESLLGCCRPLAIPWLVVSVIVSSVKRSTFWSKSHIGQEVFETALAPPSPTNLNSSTAVILPTIIIFIQASAFHVRPSPP